MAQSAELLQWSDDFRLGIPAVDQEHRRFFDLIRDLETRLASGDDPGARVALGWLRDYAETHFAHEEEFLESVGYPDLARHRGEHATFLRDVKVLEATPGVPTTVAALMARAWIATHILGTDRRYSRWLDEADEPRRVEYPTGE
jgi:hemerythrin